MALHILQLLLNGPLGMISNSRHPQVWNTLERTLVEQLFWEGFPDNQALIVETLSRHADKPSIGGFRSEIPHRPLPQQGPGLCRHRLQTRM